MTESPATYPNYKPSGVSWIGHVPTHWEVRRIKADVSDVVDLTNHRERNESYVALEHVESWTGRIIESESDPTFENQVKRFRPGDVLFGKLRPYLAKVTHAQRHGVCVGEFLVLRPHHATVDPSYLTRLIRSKPAIGAIDASIFGAKMPRADWQFIGSMLVPIPPLDEQSAIVGYLDRADELINRYIGAKGRLIALLEEQREAVIHQAVTCGLDPKVVLETSKTPQLGESPRHWQVAQLGRLGTFSKGAGGTKDDEVAEGLPCVRYGDIYTSHKHFVRKTRSFVARHRAIDYAPMQYGDVLFTGSGETIEDIGKSVVNLINGEAYCGGDVILFRPHAETHPEFLGYLLDSTTAAYQKSCMGRGITIMHVYSSQLKYLWLALPSIAEQKEIAEYLKKATEHADYAIHNAQTQIELIREYRTRLIADVVTGQIDVRDTVVELPGQHL